MITWTGVIKRQNSRPLIEQAQRSEEDFWAVQRYLENLASDWALQVSEILFDVCDGKW